MCCEFDIGRGHFHIQNVSIKNQKEGRYIHLNGIYDRTPLTRGEYLSRCFRRVELFEKIAEIADETFHLMHIFLQRASNTKVYETLRNLHHGAHDIEHVLHSCCFLGDLARLSEGKYFHDQNGNSLSYMRCISRICHLAAHFLSTAQFLKQLEICRLNRLEPIAAYSNLINAAGFGLWAISVLWDRYLERANPQLGQDLSIHLGGCLFEVVHIVEEMDEIPLWFKAIIGRLGSIAGIIHAWAIVDRLMDSDQEKVSINFKIPKVGKTPELCGMCNKP